MIKKTITYEDLDGKPKTEDFWFQITRAEFVKKAMTEGGEAYLEKLQKLADAKEANAKEIMSTFETVLKDAVGRREGNLLIKSDEVKNHFMYSGAYDAFFMELIQEPDSGATFMRNMLPKNVHGAIDEAMRERGIAVAEAEAASAEPTPFPQSLEAAVEANKTPEIPAAAPQLAEASKDDEPGWFKENRYPTQKELMKMTPEELQFAMKMKSSKAFG